MYDWRNLRVDGADIEIQLNSENYFGVIQNMPNDVYHNLTQYWSSSNLKFMSQNSPAHFKVQFMSEVESEKRVTEAMLLGSYVHDLVLTPDDVDLRYYIAESFDARTKEGKAIRERVQAEANGRVVISEALAAKAHAIGEKVKERVGGLIYGSLRELSFFWRCNYSYLPFRGRADAILGDTLLELKTTAKAHPDHFARHVYNMNYDLSLVHYINGLRANGIEIKKCLFIVVETEPPFVCEKYIVGNSFLETGQVKWLDAVDKLERGIEDDFWPGYINDRVTDELVIEAPTWAFKGEASDAV